MTDTPVERLRAAAADGRLAALCDEHDLDAVVLHGSALWSDEPNDLDVAVLAAGELDLLDVMTAFARQIEAEVDLMDLRRASCVARAHALNGQGLYERRPGLVAELHITALSERLDTAWLRRLDRDLMAAG